MSLFLECCDALSEDVEIMHNSDLALSIFNKYPMILNNIDWTKIFYKDYEDMSLLLNDFKVYVDDKVFIMPDDKDIPVLKSNLRLVVYNIYEVMALSPKLFIFNKDIVLYPLFPTYIIRVGTLI
ncbi:CDI toxin immunity protein [Acinetobacter baylyi]|uniref:CDI toxin immunity protein n=1 Tax=Acinetobacter baylyi TaxID=202950 RepID=UPI000EA18100|nr:hypothetical protein [Acinetobacter baylyi]